MTVVKTSSFGHSSKEPDNEGSQVRDTIIVKPLLDAVVELYQSRTEI